MRRLFGLMLFLFVGCAATNDLVIVDCGDKFGSGFPVKKNLVMTASHLVECGTPTVDGKPATIVRKDEKADIALLEVSQRLRPLRFCEVNESDLGRKLTVYSNAWGSAGAMTVHHLAGFVEHNGVRHLVAFPGFLSGSSGAAVILDGEGQFGRDHCVVGLVVASNINPDGSVGFAVYASVLEEFLKGE